MSEGREMVEHLRRLFDDGAPRSEIDAAPLLVFLGSSRRRGNTSALVDAVLAGGLDARLVNLSDHLIGPYDYNYLHDADDFLPLARAMTRAEAIVFATPVYWYSMSAQMKTFFDRLTDLTGGYKALGRALAGKTAFALATSGSPEPPAGFEPVFADTARYFNMRWGGMLHACFKEDRKLAPEIRAPAQEFAKKIGAAMSIPPARPTSQARPISLTAP